MAVGRDELGPKLMFITLDRQIARTQRKYDFIVNSEQFLEFMMPYLFPQRYSSQGCGEISESAPVSTVGYAASREKDRGFRIRPGLP